MSIQMMAMLDFGETLMTLGLEARMISLKMWLFLRIFLMSSGKMHMFNCSFKNRIPTILR